MTQCACGCGSEIAAGKSYRQGHWFVGRKFTPEHRARLSRSCTDNKKAFLAMFPQAGIDAAATARLGIRRGTSRLEEKVEGMLGDGWKRHQKIRRFAFDFVHEERRLAIEVNGCFFHSCPRCHPYGAHYEVQKKCQANDLKKKKALAAAGYTLAVLWECDLNAGKVHVENMDKILKKFSVETKDVLDV